MQRRGCFFAGLRLVAVVLAGFGCAPDELEDQWRDPSQPAQPPAVQQRALASPGSESGSVQAGSPSHVRRKALRLQLALLKAKHAGLPPANWPAKDRGELQSVLQAIAAEHKPLRGSMAEEPQGGIAVPTTVTPTPAAEQAYLAAKAKLADPCTPQARAYLADLKKTLFAAK